MALAIDLIDRRGPSNEMLLQLQTKKTLFITNKTEHISFKNGCDIQVAKETSS